MGASQLNRNVTTALSVEQWARAVLEGANEKCERWKHLLVLGGVLIGFEANSGRRQGGKLRGELEAAVVTATDLALNDAATEVGGELAEYSVCMVLGLCFDLLKDSEQSKIHTERLLPILPRAMFFSRDGLHSGYFLGRLDADVSQKSQDKFNWSADSPSFRAIQMMASGPVVSTLGPLSRLTAFCVERTRDIRLLESVSEDLTAFSRSLCVQWRQNKFSEVAEPEEPLFLTEETLQGSLPLLWQILKSAMFSVLVIQSAVMGHVLGSMVLSQGQGTSINFCALFHTYLTVTASALAAQTLHSLRNLYFIIARIGHSSLSQFAFVYVSSIDILSRDLPQTEAFLQQTRPSEFGRIPHHPHERYLDLFYLNTAEHLAVGLPPHTNEGLLSAAVPYLAAGGDPRLLEIFEAAHSVVLAVFAAPQGSAVMTTHLPFYITTLLQSFPQTLSARQFRLALRTVVRLVLPPNPIAVTDPLLAPTILELLRSRAEVAAATPLPPDGRGDATFDLTEQAVVALALLDCLPALPPALLREWLPLAAEAVERVAGSDALRACRAHFWDVLSSDAMDGARGEAAVFWWSTEGGRSKVFGGSGAQEREAQDTQRSGALG